MRKRKMREEDERCREQKGGARIKKGMESKINCSRHLVVTGKVITCAGFSSAATYPCRIPRRSQLFSRLYFRLTPVIEKGLSSTGQIFLRWGGTVRWRGEEKPWGETLVVISLRTRFGLQRCVFLGCLFAKIRGYDGVERDRCSRASHCIFNFLFWLDCFPFLFFFFFFWKVIAAVFLFGYEWSLETSMDRRSCYFIKEKKKIKLFLYWSSS